MVLADAALEISRIASEARQEFAGACRVDDRLGAVDRFVCELGVEREGEVQDFARVGVDAGDQRGWACRGSAGRARPESRSAEDVARQSVAVDCAKVFGVKGFASQITG